ncbi:class I SAM-dependent methyltransferase [Acinetobacter stercoris]|uniref:Ubiquinone/menaquinone biosynthesis methyltransferase n=1 Tax=Acinetobacter stercoris TaxID=2126983 RepID=A0A2U3N2T2_9GAMM|nr:class I SAM-dependent methyltransferase [Acinetobacter stercoris]SPL71978.1 ubiquinone/menaquinone biosynthesis methyltransferase [Acinetobacter stercoris]
MGVEIKTHWEHIYSTHLNDELSWYQAHATVSLELLKKLGLDKDAHIIDIGGGASVLVDELIDAGFHHLTVLDLSEHALNISQKRLESQAEQVNWKIANIIEIEFPEQCFDLWHDRAVFHFLIDPDDREQYLKKAEKSVKKNGFLIVATFAEDGPKKCSGLEIRRYSIDDLKQLFELHDFKLLQSKKEVHLTPAGNQQKFNYCVFQKL